MNDCDECPVVKTCQQIGQKERPADCLGAEAERIQTQGKAAAGCLHEPPSVTRSLNASRNRKRAELID